MDNETEASLPIRMCNELVYCPRLFHLEHVQGVFVESAETIEGSGQHERAARRGKVRRRDAAADLDGGAALPWDELLPRNMEFTSATWGVHGRLDMVDLAEAEVVAVEAKRGLAPHGDEHRWNGHDLAYPPKARSPDLQPVMISSSRQTEKNRNHGCVSRREASDDPSERVGMPAPTLRCVPRR